MLAKHCRQVGDYGNSERGKEQRVPHLQHYYMVIILWVRNELVLIFRCEVNVAVIVDMLEMKVTEIITSADAFPLIDYKDF